ncbi:quinone oxidoreductase family protein [Chitinophagaceae bacterium MMS25-I14]
MKAAVLHHLGGIPVFEDFPDPVPQHKDEVLVHMKSASVKNIDRMLVKGTHYDSLAPLPAVAGVDGVGILADGTRVYTGFIKGAMAERAIVREDRYVPLPDDVDDITAAALPNPALSAWFSLAWRAAIQPGDNVLILGATGITGKAAIQLAKYLGAGNVIATGRNEQILNSLPLLGAHAVYSLAQPEETLHKTFEEIKKKYPVDIVVDYVWGRPAEILLKVLAGHDLTANPRRVRYVQVGEMAGAAISLPAAVLRSSQIELYGVGGGSVPGEIMQQVPGEILPLLYRLAAEKKLVIDTETALLKDIENAWQVNESGKRLVITI